MGPGVFKSAEWMLETTTKALRTLGVIHLGNAHDCGFDIYTFSQTLMETAREFNIKEGFAPQASLRGTTARLHAVCAGRRVRDTHRPVKTTD